MDALRSMAVKKDKAGLHFPELIEAGIARGQAKAAGYSGQPQNYGSHPVGSQGIGRVAAKV